MNQKKIARLRRAKKTRCKIKEIGSPRLSINRSCKHMYAQVISPEGDKILVSASTLEKAGDVLLQNNKISAALIGKRIAERAKEKGITTVSFDRSGFKYHGRVQALADAAREAGLVF